MEPVWKVRNEGVLERTPDTARTNQATPPLIDRLLRVRGFEADPEQQKVLYPKLGDLRDPLSMLNMKSAVERIAQAYLQDERVCIYADFDLDGTSGLALLWTAFRDLGFKNLERYQPRRLSEGYGFHAAAVEEMAQKGVKLIITVDVGITALAASETAKKLGVDVIITDHHLPGPELPKAVAVVNPNQVGDESGLGFLCGAGVAFYLLRALQRELKTIAPDRASNFELKSVLDFFTIATLTDMVPLVEDNRVLVKHGLLRLAETTRPGLRELMLALDLSGRSLSAQDVAIRFAPKLNALSRMDSEILPIDIFLCEDQSRARELVHTVLESNQTRVTLQAQAEVTADRMLEDWAEPDFIFLESDEFHRGIVGLIATRLAQNHNKPAFVGALDRTDGMIVGSARLPNGSEACLVEALGSAKAHLSRYGGHSAAAGFELALDAKEKVITSMREHFAHLREEPRPREILYDLEVRLEDVTPAMMKWHEFVGPFGVGFDLPLFRFRDVRLEGVRSLRGGHLKLHLKPREGAGSWDALLFSPSERQKAQVESADGLLDILGEIQWNYFQGRQTVQILVRDLKVKPWQ